MNKNIVIFDLDGTLALIDKRREFCMKPNGKINWNEFHNPDNIKLDVPNDPVIATARMFAENDFEIHIFSGRSDVTEKTTRSWLAHNRIPFHSLVMRPHKTRGFVPDEVLKKEFLDNAPFDIDNVFLVVDDRQKVVDMWRDLGLTVFQVAPGDF